MLFELYALIRGCYRKTINNSKGGGSGGTVAKDALGNDVIAAEWLKNHGPNDRTLTQGLKVHLPSFKIRLLFFV